MLAVGRSRIATAPGVIVSVRKAQRAGCLVVVNSALGASQDLRALHCNMPFHAESPETNKQLMTIWNAACPEDPA